MTSTPKTARNEEASGPCVFVAESDTNVAEAVGVALAYCPYRVRIVRTGADFLAAIGPESRGCALIEANLSDMHGLDVFDALRAQGISMPVIILTACGDIPMAVAAISRGASDFLEKPVPLGRLRMVIDSALQTDTRQRGILASRHALIRKFDSLTPRESEIVEAIIDGHSAADIARLLGISARTVESHKRSIFQRLAVNSTTHLVSLALSVPTYRHKLGPYKDR